MSDNTKQTDPVTEASAIRLADRLAASEAFMSLFREGMGLVEETAAYLDGEGREESKGLSRAASLTYATESMRLTTRLMQLASWLLLQRAVNEGEMTLEQASQEKSKIRLDKLASAQDGAGWEELPQSLKDLVMRSSRLQDRIRVLDSGIYEGQDATTSGEAVNPVAAQLGRLSQAFGTGSDD
ncbi:MAG: DUF1465 domain-containing protein [Hyphomicrobiales bacterium]|nr:MAG: DUF1465 domain-containing protein [Hyphomicrobiales bacterium]